MTANGLAESETPGADTGTVPRFQRVPGHLSRDTGRHVLVLPPAENQDVQVLGGGGALIWRLLEQPLGMAEIVAALGGDDGPSLAEVEDCLSLLGGTGVVVSVERQG